MFKQDRLWLKSSTPWGTVPSWEIVQEWEIELEWGQKKFYKVEMKKVGVKREKQALFEAGFPK